VLQDGRSIMLAHEGYTVLELGYNLPKYGQTDLFARHPQNDPLTLEYFEMAIRQLLRHPKTYGDKICVIGQCKVEFRFAVCHIS